MTQELNYKFKESYKEVQCPNGHVAINQVELSPIFEVEYFPSSQAKESFEKAEFSKLVDIRKVVCDMDGFLGLLMPRDMQYQEKIDIDRDVASALLQIASTIENLEDLKNVVIERWGANDKVEIYPSFKACKG